MPLKIALAGNPNSGKTTLFNALTGSNQTVGNWPGVTVEKKEGKLKGHKDVTIVDLPGIYSLSPYTLEEVVSRNYLIGEKPDAIINIIDGSNLERNLYLTTQLTEIGIPVIIAINMMDIVNKNGDKINIEKLSKSLGCEIMEISALKRMGISELADKAVKTAQNAQSRPAKLAFQPEIEEALKAISSKLPGGIAEEQKRWYAIKFFERDEKILEQMTAVNVEEVIVAVEDALDDDSESIITNARYNFITSIIKGSYVKKSSSKITTSDKIDKVVTNRWLALPIFAVIMTLVYYIAITTVGDILTGFTNDTLFGEWISEPLAGWFEEIGAAGWLAGLIVDGIVGGVGAVLGFVPQMLVLFFLLAILEECGYMARIAFIMDRIFRRFGLSGKSFIPMLVGTGCGVPGVMATRTIESDRDRRMTVMTTTFMPCGAKMPIVALIAGAVFGGVWWVAPSAYFIGVAAIVISGIILKKTSRFAGDPSPFVMELPAYHMPTAGSVLRSTWERGYSFIKKAGTIILLASIFIWFLSSFGMVEGSFQMVEDMDASVLAAIGGVVAPIFAPLGFGTWQSTVATIMGLVAKEEVVGVFGVLYGVSGDALGLVEEGAFGSLGAIAAHFTALSAYSFLVFNLLCAPCFAAIGAIKGEMNDMKWTWFAIGYQMIFAYAIAFLVFQFGSLFSGAGFTVGTAVAALVFAGLLYLLFRPGRPTPRVSGIPVKG
ncbi:ferrous iron transport protein B [Desulfitobacterium hafniense]|uniref:Ferrous iron transport protein B n=4 Tax=root TaxID=1 RepID=Q24V33_DESHY|nr:ferrous iron transport protein B [Desulfitobacterium hafniense]ACL21477.1 ferrous iron transport protein B [Desulfitobacterium hafniense DCB-2]MEA5023169.1 ferrous iron transport protein B [Desulfitobacterium hafniense]BAE84109.1 ferrous iron transport protein B [Desulfitobacterium hafniense Y51]CDX02397.1 Ferrous iron transport protein B homolog [Desulfitobacterium hafniense]